jgi:hypothetical protein
MITFTLVICKKEKSNKRECAALELLRSKFALPGSTSQCAQCRRNLVQSHSVGPEEDGRDQPAGGGHRDGNVDAGQQLNRVGAPLGIHLGNGLEKIMKNNLCLVFINELLIKYYFDRENVKVRIIIGNTCCSVSSK